MPYTVTSYDPAQLDRAMVPIPAGPVVFGLTAAQKSALAANAGVHPDMLYYHADARALETGAFWMDRYPVTRGQFLRFMQETGYTIQYAGWNVGWSELTAWPDFSEEKHPLPIVGVNAQDAEAYAAWLGKRLPTEVEWEKAWRGGDGRLFPWGNTWEDGQTFRNPGNISLQPAIPVGAARPTGPYGLSDFGLVLEWVQSVFPATSTSGHPDHNAYVLAGGSFLHTRDYSFLPAHRSSWASAMRIYNSGFRCVSDTPPTDLVGDPDYRVTHYTPPQPVPMRKDLYLRAPIRLVPTGWATFSMFVPWFPESVWVLDCPEGNWDVFGGANAWPSKPEAEWRVPWQVEGDGARISYARTAGEKKQVFAAWVEGNTVYYSFRIEHIGPMRASSFCFKTLSPFFSSQERRTQVRLDGDRVTPCDTLPVDPSTNVSFGWSLGEIIPPARAAFRSYDGSGWVIFNEGHHTASGNGWPPCTHLNPCTSNDPAQNGLVTSGGGSFTFAIE